MTFIFSVDAGPFFAYILSDRHFDKGVGNEDSAA